MKRTEINVKTTITVDLGDFPTRDLIDELEDRGHMVDNSDLQITSAELLDGLAHRGLNDFIPSDTRELVKALKYAGCPNDIVERLEVWQSEPLVDDRRLQKWLEFCQR